MQFELHASRGQSPVGIEPFNEWVHPTGELWTQFFRAGNDGYLLRFPDRADFLVSRSGEKVQGWPVPGVDVDEIDDLYLNQVVPLARSRQGKFVLHASAVEVGDGAMAFLGHSGQGKSTLTASFVSSGYRFLTDDALMLEKTADAYQAMPHHPSIRMWDESIEALVREGAAIAPPTSSSYKVRFLAGDGGVFCNEPRRLKRLYFLAEGPQPEHAAFEALTPAQALVALVKQSFLLDMEEQTLIAAHFDELVSLVQEPICYRLYYPRRYEDLDRVRQAIIEHAHAQGVSPAGAQIIRP